MALAWRTTDLLTFLARRARRRAWRSPNAPDGLKSLIRKLPSKAPRCWRVTVERLATRYPDAPWDSDGGSRVLVLDVVVDEQLESWLPVWWAADFAGNMHLRIWDHEGVALGRPLLDEDPFEWESLEYSAACHILEFEASMEFEPVGVDDFGVWHDDDDLDEEPEAWR